jgi:hypothetical protein
MATTLTRRFSSAGLPVLLAGMDACWIYIAAWLFGTYVLARIAHFPLPSPVMLAALELGAWWLAAMLTDRTRLPVWAVQTAVGVVGLAAALGVAVLTVPPVRGSYSLQWLGVAVYGMIVSLALWFIGGYRASERSGFTAAYVSFRIGLIIVALAALLTTVFAGSRTEFVWADLGAVPLWFFGLALGALALGNREVVRRESGVASAGSWTLVLVVSVLGIILIGASAGAFGGQNALELLQDLVAGAFVLVAGVFYLVIYAIAWGVSFFNPNLEPIRRQPPNVEDAFSIKGHFGQTQPPDLATPPVAISQDLINISTWTAGAVLALAAIWLISRGVRRTRRERGRDSVEERESLGSWALLVQQMRAWLERLLRRWRPAAIAAATAQEDDLAALRGPEWSGTLSVRQIYARLQRLAGSLGFPRAPQQTPVEYLSVLSARMPNLRDDFADITAAYLEARYGPLPASGPAVAAATSAWKRAEPAMRTAAETAGIRV